MRPIKEDLYNLVSDSLYEACWRSNLPVNPEIGISSLLEAIRKFGIKTEVGETSAKFYLPVSSLNNRLIDTELTFDEILEGWERGPKGSFRSLSESTYQIHDNVLTKIERKTERFGKETKTFSAQRHHFSRSIRKLMEKELRPYFSKYQEKALVFPSGKIQPLTNPWIFHLTVKETDLEIIKEARKRQLFGRMHGGPTAETIVREENLEFDSTYFPSTNTLSDLFWGKYLNTLTKLYKLPLASEFLRKKDRLAYLVERGYNGLKPLTNKNCKPYTFENPSKIKR